MRMRLLLPFALLALPLAACSGGGGSEANDGRSGNNSAAQAPKAGDGRLAEVLAGNSDLERLNRIVGGAGLTQLLEGVGPYTVFAPTNRAIDGLGEGRGDALAGAEMRPQAAALLRAHIVPGTITRSDLERSIGGAGNRPVRMRTMADTTLTFSREDDAIVVASDDGSRARLSGGESLAANGAVHPIDGILRRTR